MTELQKVFLFYTFLYFVVKGSLFLGFYVAMIMMERTARIKHAKCKVLMAQKRTSEQERWKTAYALYNKKHQLEHSQVLTTAV